MQRRTPCSTLKLTAHSADIQAVILQQNDKQLNVTASQQAVYPRVA